MDVKKITEEIKSVRINLASMHPSEEEHIARLFFGEIMENGWYGMDEVNSVLSNLNYPQHTKDVILDIAETICCLRDQPQTRGREPESYKRVMQRFFNNN